MTDEQKQLLIKLEQLAKFKSLLAFYTKPGTGIPATDLAQAVQDSLGLADTALQQADLDELNGKVAALESLISEDGNPTAAIDKFNEIVDFLANITNTQTLEGILAGINTAIAAKYTKPGTGIPATDLAQAVQDSLGLAGTALQPITPVADPTASGTSVEFISCITQAADGSITPQKKAVQQASASQAGLMSAAHFAKLETISYATDADIEAIFE